MANREWRIGNGEPAILPSVLPRHSPFATPHSPHQPWSNPSLKDHLALFTHGVVGQWTIPRRTGRDYIEQMTAEVREEREDSRGRIKALWVQKRRDNHYLDCELMIDAAAIISAVTSNAEPGRQISSQIHPSSGL